MRNLHTILAALLLCAAPAQAQTLKTLSYNTNGEVIYSGTNTLTFTNTALRVPLAIYLGTNGASVSAGGQFLTITDGSGAPSIISGTNLVTFYDAINWSAATNAAITRTNLGLGATWLTNTNVTNFRTSIGLGVTNDVEFVSAALESIYRAGTTNISIDVDDNQLVSAITESVMMDWGGTGVLIYGPLSFSTNSHAATTRTNLGLGATNNVTFANVTATTFGESGSFTFNSDDGAFRDGTNIIYSVGSGTRFGDSIIRQTTATNGLLYIYRTNAEAFLGLANLIASNNTTISNETLFRVGVSEATNKAAQFGFRSTNTNGNGVAVFSVFGYNALMMIGPSDPAAGTNPIQATVYSIAPTNKVMTLITTNTGAMQMHRPIGIDTAGVFTNAPTNTTNVAGWIQFYVGTNSVRVPYYQ